MCCARPMYLRCCRTDPSTACLIHLNEQLFCIRGGRSLNHTPTASLIAPFIQSTTLVINLAIFMVEIGWGHALGLLLSVLHPMHQSSLCHSLQSQRVWFLLLSQSFRSDIVHFLTCSWWLHQMETISALLAICAGNSPVPGELPTQRPVTRSFDVFLDLHSNEQLSKQRWGLWFEMPPCPLRRHCNVT